MRCFGFTSFGHKKKQEHGNWKMAEWVSIIRVAPLATIQWPTNNNLDEVQGFK
jgi:hypothetical protein